jgi:hypothetical protein
LNVPSLYNNTKHVSKSVAINFLINSHFFTKNIIYAIIESAVEPVAIKVAEKSQNHFPVLILAFFLPV